MDIHDSENNLIEINNSSENIEVNQDNLNDNLEEMNPYANESESIHDEKEDDNIVINMEEKETSEGSNISNEYFKAKLIKTIISNHNNKIKYKQIIDNWRNDIMRSVTIQQRNAKSKVKQVITGVKPTVRYDPTTANHRLNVLRCKHISPSENFITQHSIGNFIRDTPEVNDIHFENQIPHKESDYFHSRNDPVNSSFVVTPLITTSVVPDNLTYQTIPPVVEKTKQDNLAEILTSVLQEVLHGKLNSVENIIGKLRVEFEEKNVITSTKKRNIILLNFEDDTMRPVLKIDEKYMTIIEKWYNDCDLLIDIEETNVSIPEVITSQDVIGVLFQDINYKFKDEYLNSYIPLVIDKIISQRIIKCFENKYFNKISTTTHQYPIEINNYNNFVEEQIYSVIGDNILSDMGIIIPEDIKSQPLNSPNDKNTLHQNNISPWNLTYDSKRIYPENFIKKHILDDNKNVSSDESNEILPYNNFFNTFYNFTLFDNSEDEIIPVECYNSQYNTLYPNFFDNCIIIDNIDYKKVEEKNISSIVVLINDKFLQTLTIINPNQDMLHIIKNYSEFGFYELFGITTNNNDIVNFIEREFNKAHFNDIDEVNKKLIVTSQYIQFSNKHNHSNNIASSEENQVKTFFNCKYTIDDDIHHKIKASTLYDIIINSKVVKIDNDKITGFRTRLSKYLKDIGLQKKRYNDGFYYYGIVEKGNKNFIHTSDNNKHINIDELEKQRYEDLKSFYEY